MQKLQNRQNLLELNTKLNALKIERETQLQEVTKLQEEVNSINAKADTKTDSFSASDTSAKTTVKDARKTASLLRSTEKANRKLAKAQNKLGKIDKNIQKVQQKLDQINKEIEFVDKTQ